MSSLMPPPSRLPRGRDPFRCGPALLACAWTALAAPACKPPPPVLESAAERPDLPLLALLEPHPTSVLYLRPAELSATPLGGQARAWFEPTPEEAARGGPPLWFKGLGGAQEAAIGLWGETEAPPTARAVRGGPLEAEALARAFAERTAIRGATREEWEASGVRVFAAGPEAVAAVARDRFLLAPVEMLRAACARAAGDGSASAADDPALAPLAERLDLATAHLAYLGRVPAPLRRQLQHWGVDPLVDRAVGVAVRVAEDAIAVRLVAELDGAEDAAALVESARAGIAFMADRRGFRLVGLDRLLLGLTPRAEGRFFYVEGELPTAAVSLLLGQLDALTEAAERM